MKNEMENSKRSDKAERRPVMKKAVAYTSDIVLGKTGEVVTRAYQKELIASHAAENNMEVVAWFEDETYNEDVMSRPGIRAMMAYAGEYDTVVTERVWAFSRSMSKMEEVFKEMDRRGVTYVNATTMWDCTSQKCRRRFNPALPAVKPVQVVTREEATPVKVRKPARMNFVPFMKGSAYSK